MNILGLISQLIGIKTLRLTLPTYHVMVETDSGSSSSDDKPDEAPHVIEDGG